MATKTLAREGWLKNVRLTPAWIASLATAVLCVFTSTACIPFFAKGPPSLEAFVSARFIPAPKDVAFVSVAWPPGTQGPAIWIRHESPFGASGPADDPLFILDLETSQMRPLPLPDDPTCKDTGHQFPEMLPDGRLGYIQFCFGGAPPEQTKRLMAYDFTKQTAAPLESYFLNFSANVYDFEPDM
ncbi:MAG TPA: hypothetical protein VFZ25_01500, partial [Chloroflexota bacterium]|nr:hypothetical protein [Chloroflexota bacterium]